MSTSEWLREKKISARIFWLMEVFNFLELA